MFFSSQKPEDNYASINDHDDESSSCSSYDGEDGLIFLKWDNPWLLSIPTTCLLLIPMLIGAIIMAYSLTGRSWPCSLFSVHLTLSLVAARILLNSKGKPLCHTHKLVTSMSSMSDVILIHFVYIGIWNHFVGFFFTDIDGTTIAEWTLHKHVLMLLSWLGKCVILSRTFVGGSCLLSRWSLVGTQFLVETERLSRWLNMIVSTSHRRTRILVNLRQLLTICILLSSLWACVCLASIIAHFTSFQVWVTDYEYCDPLDTTECSLPFPSFHHMVRDASTDTGWRVILRGESFPFLRGGLRIQADFANQLDGFSTMAPLLFYLDGLKEAHEMDSSNAIGLQGPENIAKSVTPFSITLLLNVNTSTLVPHTAEIDYLDPGRPLVMAFPAQPLHHATHYALAVVNSTNMNGERLPPTPGMKDLMKGNNYADIDDMERFWRYTKVVIPAFEKAAPWFSYSTDPDSLQLLFDFTTVSAQSQLGPIRAVRDRTLEIIDSDGWGSWDGHIKILKVENKDCTKHNVLMSRIIHASLEVPWFLNSLGRDATLDQNTLNPGLNNEKKGDVKFTVQVPCSVHQHALNATNGTALRAIVEYGHGLLYNRDEAFSHALQRMAEDQGYIVTAMDWRGMSNFDMPVVMKTLLSSPRMFAATRDNVIQGYAGRICLQHMTKNFLLDAKWLQFKDSLGDAVSLIENNSKLPISVFYGSSQGGILGAGYTTLLAQSGLIKRGILGVPGTSFSLILSRSLGFKTYDALMLINFYSNRQVRIVLTIFQMGWDPVEAAGMLAPTVEERPPRMLLQSGLGDATVPAIAGEALARAYNASTLPNNPRKVFGLQEAQPANASWRGPRVTFTELLYEKEYLHLPFGNQYPEFDNNVHTCLRQDCQLIGQIAEFINTGRIIDPCTAGACIRTSIPCYLGWKKKNTKPSNWTCVDKKVTHSNSSTSYSFKSKNLK